jgi:lipopolysaccharide transport system permease protein
LSNIQNTKHVAAVTLIKPPDSWAQLDIGEIVGRRELLYFLVWRDIKIRYKQTAIGIAWAVLQPVLSVAIFTIIFGRFSELSPGAIPYPLFALSGLMIWLFVHTSISMASNSFVGNVNLITKVYFPRLILPVAAVISGVVELTVSLVILALLMAYYGVFPTWQIALAPVFLALAISLASGLGLLFSAMNVRFRDVKFGLPFLLQIWMVASPVFYPSSILPDRWKMVFAVNPLTGILEGLRSSLFGVPFDEKIIAISLVSLVVIIGTSIFVFRWMEDEFADII